MSHHSPDGPSGWGVGLAGDRPDPLPGGTRRHNPWAAGAGLVVVAAYAALLAYGMSSTSYDMWGALVVAPCLLLVSWPLLLGALKREPDRWVRRIIVVAFALKLVGALARWAVAFVLYDGSADAARYDRGGAAVADQLQAGVFPLDLGAPLVGTGFLVLLTGIVYVLIGPTLLGAYLVFAWLGFWGLYLFYRAFRTALPAGNHWRYALLVFLLPSMIFWPSGIGKEAWMTLAIGLAALGGARLITGARGAALPLGLGLAASVMVRPHMSAIVFLATVAGYLFRRDVRRTVLTPVARVLTLIVLAGLGFLIAGRAAQFFGVDSVSLDSVNSVLASTENRAVGGGSAFEAHPVHSVADLPVAIVTVLFRPFPWEVTNLQGLTTSVEGMLLLGLTLVSLGRIRSLWRYPPCRAYGFLCVTYLLLFVYAFSTFNNFGLLARQRVLVYPFLLALLCLPSAREIRRREAALPPAQRKALVR